MNSIVIELLPQETGGNYKFNGQAVMTNGFQYTFGNYATKVALTALYKIKSRYVSTFTGADYLQVCKCYGKKFWVIDDVDHITFLLPEEY